MTKRALIESATQRVVQIVNSEAEQFEIHGGLFWTDCPDDTESYFLRLEDGTFEDPHAANRDQFGNTVEPFYMQRLRAYASPTDQLDMLYKEIANTGTISKDGAWFQHLSAVKAAIPKPAMLVTPPNTQPDIVVPQNPPPGYAQGAAPTTGNIVQG
jgi:hypothetical protein